MSNIKVLNNVSLYNSITAASGVRTPEIDGVNNQLVIKPNPESLYDDRYLVIEPTGPSDIHIRAGGPINQSTANLRLGGEYNHVEISDYGQYVSFATGVSAVDGWHNWQTMGSGQPWWVATEIIGISPNIEYRNSLALPNNSHIYGGSTIDESGQVTWHGTLSVTGNLNVAGSAIFHNTEYTTTSSISVSNTGTGPALVVNQTGEEAIAAFYDDSNIALYIDGTTSRAGNVGIGTSTPDHKLTVIGDVSASGRIYSSYTINKFVSTFGDASNTSYTIPHGLGVQDVVVSIVDSVTQEVVYPLVTNTAMNQITVSFSEAPGLTAYKAIVIG